MMTFKDEVQVTLGRRLQEAREAAGFSLRRLAYEIDVPELTIQRWERGGNLPLLKNVVAYAKAVGADPWALWHGRERTPEERQAIREILRSSKEEEAAGGNLGAKQGREGREARGVPTEA
jgi:transcriptional regulator with XRE-family HTH domain